MGIGHFLFMEQFDVKALMNLNSLFFATFLVSVLNVSIEENDSGWYFFFRTTEFLKFTRILFPLEKNKQNPQQIGLDWFFFSGELNV